ncbi:TetR/AcrR family transcriptional regulator [Actinoplanes couchii]|uniref:TetR family transcriptional regulator n=1 Tax=Actinoplanes couchii TaxID=403638 RepID=A0ABQ3XSN4_9ACTN|nr:TetR/AcrR family transcriptional regulator [Actinoplanes couchii]MDR6318544.1 AcrR family transcriptional regulator [Actinoplanes couchii]GID61523.1 TetR family transcriptional regulator [Actinoplanes couchii]
MVRADKARNQEIVLAAAGRLFDAARDPDDVSMDAVAAEAGVGKGTIFRGFGDRAGLIRALYEQRAAAFVAQTHREAPAHQGSPADAVHFLLLRLWQFKRQNRMLALSLDRAGQGSPYRNDSYDDALGRLKDLLAHHGEQADFLAHALLAAVRSDLVEHLRDRPDEEIAAGLRTLVDRVAGRHPNLPCPAGNDPQ